MNISMKRAAFLALSLGLLSCGGKQPSVPEIELREVSTIGGEADEFMSLPLVSPRRADGRFMAIMDNTESLPRVYDADGRMLFTIGQAGSGPGEFRSPTVTVTSADSFIVFDRSLARATVFLNDSAIRSFPLQSMIAAAIELRDGTLAVSVLGWRSDIPFQHLSRDGTLLGTFGDDGALNVMSVAPDGTIWTATTYNRCQVSHWSPDLKLISRREYCEGWFEPYEEYMPVTPDAPPASIVTGVWADSSNLWVAGLTADPRWKEGLGEKQVTDGNVWYPNSDQERIHDFVIDAYDLRAGARIAQLRSDWGRVMVSEPGVVIHHVKTEDGWPAAELYEVTLEEESE